MTIKSENTYLKTVAGLFQDYIGIHTDEAARLAILAGQFQSGDERLNDRKNMVGHLTASALVLNIQNHALLIHHRFLKRWLQPGGHLDAGELPECGALRELLEETGLSGVSGPIDFHPRIAAINAASIAGKLPIDIDSHPIPAASAKGEGEHLHHDFQYIFKLEDAGDIALDQAEVLDYKWASLADLASGDYGQRLKRVALKIAAAQE